MIETLLIANRGEIACRVISTARAMGIRTVAVYSDADATAKHVEMADVAVHIGPAPVAESYLQGMKIIMAALEAGADAIHPGYGFLSENPEFVDAVEAAGLIFVGPPASAIRAMGLKDAAKVAMEAANVPVVPGYHGPDQDASVLAQAADEIGYPVLIKARAGGGGKGMRLVERAEDFAEALASAAREGQASFGDPAVLIEKFIQSPRHIEMQVFADKAGNTVHLFERDCSLQRRHQKVIEEAPAPGMTDEVRAAMGRAAVEAARAIGYVGAGTVEFIVDGSGPLRPDGFWFMEMNTRLQVEHPVTEAITGLDLVELQLRVAAGEDLPFAQENLTIDGHSFEARLYAEDADADFLPATGSLAHLRFPRAEEFTRAAVRVDSGVRPGDAITPFYDPMIAKIIVHGPDRASALRLLTKALSDTQVAGTVTNAAFLKNLSAHAGFKVGDIDTGLIARDMDGLLKQDRAAYDRALAVAAVAELGLPVDETSNNPWTQRTGWRAWGVAGHRAVLSFRGRDVSATVQLLDGARYAIDGAAFSLRREGDELIYQSEGVTHRLAVVTTSTEISVFDQDGSFTFTRFDPLLQAATDAEASDTVMAPMPGLVTSLMAKAGAAVKANDPLLVLEAMKMEHTLRAPRDGVVAEVMAEAGHQVENGAVLVRLEAVDG